MTTSYELLYGRNNIWSAVLSNGDHYRVCNISQNIDESHVESTVREKTSYAVKSRITNNCAIM